MRYKASSHDAVHTHTHTLSDSRCEACGGSPALRVCVPAEGSQQLESLEGSMPFSFSTAE